MTRICRLKPYIVLRKIKLVWMLPRLAVKHAAQTDSVLCVYASSVFAGFVSILLPDTTWQSAFEPWRNLAIRHPGNGFHTDDAAAEVIFFQTRLQFVFGSPGPNIKINSASRILAMTAS